MSNSCTIRPTVKNSNGEVVDSQLFKDARKALSYADARELYLRTKSPAFIEKYNDSSKLKFDENGEPTFDSVKLLSEFQDIIGFQKRKEIAEKEVGANQPEEATRENIDAADQKAVTYNKEAKTSGEFIADTEIFIGDDGNEYVQVIIKKNTKEAREHAAQISKKRALNRKLLNMLEKLGVSVGTLNELEQKMRVQGVTDFQAAQLVANGMVEAIRLAKGQAGQEALPEEFSHLILEALQNNPIVKRLEAAIRNGNLAGAILGEDYDYYNQLYDGNEEMLIKEAMGTLVAKHILAQVGITDSTTEGYTDIKGLVSRTRGAFDEKFSQQDEYEYLKALKEAEAVAGEFAEAIMNSDLYKSADISSITSTDRFYQVQNTIDKKKELATKLIENTQRRFIILESRSNDVDKEKAEEELKNYMDKYTDGKYDEAVYDFMSDAMHAMPEIEETLNEIAAKADELPFNTVAKKLKRVKDYLRSYENALKVIYAANTEGTIVLDTEKQALLTQLNGFIASLMSRYESMSGGAFVEFIKGFIGDGIEVPYGKLKGKKYTAEDIAKLADHDIGGMDRWLDSMANSTDMVLRMMDSVVKTAKGQARLDTLEYKHRIDAAWKRLQSNGVNDTKFMYKYVDGKKTFSYISPEEARHLPLAQQNYYFEMMDIKKELDAKLPNDATSTYNIIRVRKDLLDRVRAKGSFKDAGMHLLESFRDSFFQTAEDTEFGGARVLSEDESGKKVLLDFEDRKVDRLPIYYVNSREGEEAENISEDMNGTLLMYAQMCTSYAHMNDVIGTLELIRDRMYEREVQQTMSGTKKALVNVLNAFGVEVKTPYTKKGEATNIVKRMNDWFSAQVYGQYMNDGEVFGMSAGKLANAANAFTALNTFAMNVLSGISNVMTGSVMMRIEGVSRQFFTRTDTAKADAIFTSQLLSYLGDVGSEVKSSKLALFDELFNVMQEFEEDVTGARYTRSRVRKLADSNTLYIMNNAGELWMQNRTALALANATKLKTADGNPISLWDALQVVERDGVKKLEIIPGVTKEDGSEFDSRDIIDFTNKSKGINQRMHGIYNYEDRNAAQATAAGKMALMFRKWVVPNLRLKYGSLKYNYDLQDWEEGYWRTAGRFAQQLYRNVRQGQMNFLATWRAMSPEEIANMKKALMESWLLLMCTLAFGLLSRINKAHDDDDDSFVNSWAFQQLKYQARRLKAEIGATTPGINMLGEALTILKSPAAGINTMETFLGAARLVMPDQILVGVFSDSEYSVYNKVMKSGKYKGKTKARKLIGELVPMNRTIYRGLHPNESLNFFTQND